MSLACLFKNARANDNILVALVGSGYVIVNALMRFEESMSVERAVRKFAEGRMPGIYKDGEMALPLTRTAVDCY